MTLAGLCNGGDMGVVERVARWLSAEDGRLDDFATDAGGERTYQMERAEQILAVVRDEER